MLVLKDARVVTVAGRTLERGTVLVEDGKIAACGADVAVPAGAEVLDLTGKWLTPGLIDAQEKQSK